MSQPPRGQDFREGDFAPNVYIESGHGRQLQVITEDDWTRSGSLIELGND